MTTHGARIRLLLFFGFVLLTAPIASGAAPAPCQVLPAETWSAVMGYTATATPGDMVCTYEGAGKAGAGQFRIMAVVGSSAEADASVKRMRDRLSKSSHSNLAIVDSQGTVVFVITLFQHAPADGTAAQLQKLVAAAKQRLSK